MDEMKAIRDLLLEPPLSPATVTAARRRVTAPEAVDGVGRKRRTGRFAAGLGLTAAAAAAVAVMVSNTAGPAPVATGSSASPQRILLAAATIAEARPPGSGTYWHLKTVYTFHGRKSSQETWQRRDGQVWISLKPGTAVKSPSPGGFSVADNKLTFGQLEKLPADPSALKLWTLNAARHTEDGPVPDSATNGFVFGALASLLSEAPAPPKVRAAAFRAMASLPGVKNLGEVEGGRALTMSTAALQTTVVVDPATSLVHSSRDVSKVEGKIAKDRTTIVVAAEWTNTLPVVVPLPTTSSTPVG